MRKSYVISGSFVKIPKNSIKSSSNNNISSIGVYVARHTPTVDLSWCSPILK